LDKWIGAPHPDFSAPALIAFAYGLTYLCASPIGATSRAKCHNFCRMTSLRTYRYDWYTNTEKARKSGEDMHTKSKEIRIRKRDSASGRVGLQVQVRVLQERRRRGAGIGTEKKRTIMKTMMLNNRQSRKSRAGGVRASVGARDGIGERRHRRRGPPLCHDRFAQNGRPVAAGGRHVAGLPPVDLGQEVGRARLVDGVVLA